jgi:methyl-accepting chemotaxis protein
VSTLFRPAAALLSRLRYAHKILLVATLLVVPLGFVTVGYVDIQREKVDFSASERDGLVYLKPLLDLTVRAVQARHLAVTGGEAAAAGVPDAVATVDRADAEYGSALGTTSLWTSSRDALRRAADATGPAATFAAYNDATAQLLAVISRVSDQSNLTLDPDLDSFYVSEILAFRLPVLLDTAGRAVDRGLLYAGGTPEQIATARVDLTSDAGILATTTDAVQYAIQTAYANTTSDALLATKSMMTATLNSVGTALAEVNAAVQGDRGLAELQAATADTASRAIAELNGEFLPILDGLLENRIAEFEAKTYAVEAAAVLGLLGVYLLVGFYRAATTALRRMVDALDGLAGGDLTRFVPIDTRDEVGRMATAFNVALTRVSQAIQALRGNASAVAGSSTELTQVSRQLRAAAEDTSVQTERVSTTATQVAHNAADAAAVAAQAVRAADASNDAVIRLGRSSTEIGDVVSAITTIAGQINLLALNATIEAARAGEAGRGFAVVANEVKDLANEAGRATEDITARVEAIQADTGAAVSAIAEIGEVIRKINDIQATITSAVGRQTGAASPPEPGGEPANISDGLASVARSAEQTTSNALVTENAANQLAGTAEDLEAIIARFRTIEHDEAGQPPATSG